MSEISIGNELKDSYKTTAKWITNGINWLGDIEEFYRERATIEKEYASRLQELTKRHFEKKARQSALLSVGDEPQVTPGSLECASVVLWTEVLNQTEAIAAEKHQLSREINTKIADNLALLKGKSSRVAKHIDAVNELLLAEKAAVEDEVHKSKKHYDTLCQAMESARQKNQRLASEKTQRKLAEKEYDMNVGKNDYLIKINIANRLKDKYYYQDVPEVLDYYQELNELRVGLLNKLLKNASIVERNSHDRVKEKLHAIDETIDQNNPKLDITMFIKHNQTAWKEPADFYFIPCDIWHDDESLVTKEPELTDLKRRLNASAGAHARNEEACLSLKQKLEEITALRKQEDSLTLKFDAKLYDSVSLLNRFMKDDAARVKTEVEIEVIQNFAGDQDLSYVEPTKQKKSRFGLFKSKEGAPTQGDAASIHTVVSNTSGHLGLFTLRRNKTQTSSNGGNAKALYAYSAGGDDEVSVAAGQALEVVDYDDGSGWTMVRTLDTNQQGLVPTSYIEITDKKKGPSVPPKRGAKRVQYVEALYDYAADGEDELAIKAGDRIVLIQDDTDGSGWTEGELDGVKGLFPTAYVKKI